MNRVHKRLVGLVGLAAVLGVTMVAAGIPSVDDVSAASQEAIVQFNVQAANPGDFRANIATPADGATYYTDRGVTARISYQDATSISVYLTYPDGTRVLVDTITPGNPSSGILDVVLPVNNTGEYLIELEGKDLVGNTVPGNSVSFFYRAVTAKIIDRDTIDVSFGDDVCKLGFQAYRVTDTARANPLLDPEYIVDVVKQGTDLPYHMQVNVPGLAQYALGDITVVVKGYDCSNNELDEDDDTAQAETPRPPQSGAINILGMTISRTDYLVTGLIAFVLVAALALLLVKRQKKSRR